MELDEKVDKLSLKVERNISDIDHMKKTMETQQEKIENFQEFVIASRAEQAQRDKSLNTILTIVMIISATSPVLSAWLTKVLA